MDTAALIPLTEPISVAWGWFEGLLLFTFVLHLLLMNTVLGSVIINFFRSLGGNGGSPVAKDMSKKLPTGIALAVNFGVAPLLFLQVLYGQFMYVSDILLAVFWLSVILAVILAYYGSYVYDFRFDALGGGRVLVLGFVLLLLLFVSFVFSNNLTLLMTPERWTAYFGNASGTFLNFGEPTLWPRWLHFVTASVAVAGLFQAIVWQRKKRKDSSLPPIDADVRVASGMRWFAFATLAQMGVGVWFLLSLPRPVMMQFMGAPTDLPKIVFIVAMLAAVAAFIAGLRSMVRAAAVFLLAAMGCMAGMREMVRMAYLAPYYSPSEQQLVPQYLPMILFLITFAAGLAIIGHILKLAARAGKEA